MTMTLTDATVLEELIPSINSAAYWDRLYVEGQQDRDGILLLPSAWRPPSDRQPPPAAA